MQSFFNKRKASDPANEPTAKRERSASSQPHLNDLLPSPAVIVAWNCNGLTSRLRSASDALQIKKFVTEHKPDLFFLSEVRLPAANNSTNGKPGPNTKCFRSRMKVGDTKSMDEATMVRMFFSSPELSDYKVYYSLADTKYAGTAMLLNTSTTQPPKSVRYNMDRLDVKGSVHDSDGRIIVAKFADFSVLHTYSPNNGFEESHFKRRRAWDEKVRSFMERKRDAGVRIMWVGDLNVAPRDEDLSHATYFRKQKGGRNASRKGVVPDVAPEDIGQPGCTDRERKGLDNIMENGDLTDAFRELHGDDEAATFTWRGNTTGKYSGRGMRIDHCIISKSLMPDVKKVDVMGYGSERLGFMGSDHCPVIVEMRRGTEKDKETTDTPRNEENGALNSEDARSG